ncbi:hypothetical protein G7Y89_g14139 [Cudoniella acicularis]|uniref:Uncharacterized protein n=1 Tax=Cudoniella acicularis TaxID=354080 RepID=A0A8H4R8E2_9HELO|nr:hypothetical protein G7Y89_g14139 [Cudoniella acicularis]
MRQKTKKGTTVPRPGQTDLCISIYEPSRTKTAGEPTHDLVYWSGLAVMFIQLAITTTPIITSRDWSVLTITVGGTSLALMMGSLAQWRNEKWACRRNSYILTHGNGAQHATVILGNGRGLDLEDLAVAGQVKELLPEEVTKWEELSAKAVQDEGVARAKTQGKPRSVVTESWTAHAKTFEKRRGRVIKSVVYYRQIRRYIEQLSPSIGTLAEQQRKARDRVSQSAMDPPPYTPRATFRAQDLETASIRSAAPSYISEAPSYTSRVVGSPSPHRTGLPSPYASSTQHARANSAPSLEAFRRPTWSRTQVSNPTARHYHSVAHRRASARTIHEQSSLLVAALNGEDGIAQIKKKMDEEERARMMRTNEDPYLVGEEAAERNKQERLRRENGNEVLEIEDKRWDWLIAQMADWEERDQSWKKFRQEVEEGKRSKLAKRLGLGRSRV